MTFPMYVLAPLRITCAQTDKTAQPPEFQMVPLPKTNPVLTGERWKQYHSAIGLGHIVDESWRVVQEEKSADMTHILQFPYNGEAPGVRAFLLSPLFQAPLTPLFPPPSNTPPRSASSKPKSPPTPTTSSATTAASPPSPPRPTPSTSPASSRTQRPSPSPSCKTSPSSRARPAPSPSSARAPAASSRSTRTRATATS